MASAAHASDDGAEVGGGDGARDGAAAGAASEGGGVETVGIAVGAGVCLVRHTEDDVFHIQLDDV